MSSVEMNGYYSYSGLGAGWVLFGLRAKGRVAIAQICASNILCSLPCHLLPVFLHVAAVVEQLPDERGRGQRGQDLAEHLRQHDGHLLVPRLHAPQVEFNNIGIKVHRYSEKIHSLHNGI